jgi:hypothetical protein
VCSFETNDISAEATFVSTHRAAILVGEEYFFPEFGRASTLFFDWDDFGQITSLEIETYGIGDLPLK